jgi:hypothetical protein
VRPVQESPHARRRRAQLGVMAGPLVQDAQLGKGTPRRVERCFVAAHEVVVREHRLSTHHGAAPVVERQLLVTVEHGTVHHAISTADAEVPPIARGLTKVPARRRPPPAEAPRGGSRAAPTVAAQHADLARG